MACPTAAAWLFGFLIFFPILWMVLTSFKTELEAFAMPPKFLFFRLDHWRTTRRCRSAATICTLRSTRSSLPLGSTLVALLFAIPAAWAMAFAPAKRTKDLLLWMLSTKMMPPVGALIPIYLIFRDFGLLDSRGGLIVILFLAQPADRDLDAVHLLQGDPERDPGSGAHGWRDPVARDSSMC